MLEISLFVVHTTGTKYQYA